MTKKIVVRIPDNEPTYQHFGDPSMYWDLSRGEKIKETIVGVQNGDNYKLR